MSLKTWRDEFMPILPSEQAHDHPIFATELVRIEHALQKWKGLRKEALEAHDVLPWCGGWDLHVPGEGLIELSGSNCSLCSHIRHQVGRTDCELCPLYQLQGVSCDGTKHERDLDADYERALREVGGEQDDPWPGNPWSEWTEKNDPEPMIELLERARDHAMFKESLE